MAQDFVITAKVGDGIVGEMPKTWTLPEYLAEDFSKDMPQGWSRMYKDAFKNSKESIDDIEMTFELLKEMAELLENVCPKSEVIRKWKEWK